MDAVEVLLEMDRQQQMQMMRGPPLPTDNWRNRACRTEALVGMTSALSFDATTGVAEVNLCGRGTAQMIVRALDAAVHALYAVGGARAIAIQLPKAGVVDKESGVSELVKGQMSEAIIGRIDEMGTRIDDLEHSIGDLMAQAGIDEAAEGESGAAPETAAKLEQ